MELGDHPGVVLAQGAAPVDQDPQHRKLFVVDHRPQSAHPGPHQRNRMRIGGVGLTSLAGREDPRTCRELRWDIDDFFAHGEEPMSDVVPDPGASLDRPNPARKPVDIIPHRGEPIDIGAEPAPTYDGLIAGHHLDRGRALVRVHADHNAASLRTVHLLLLARSITGCRAGRATLLQQDKPFLSLSWPKATPGPHRPNESHTTSVGSRNESDEPDA